MKNNWKILLSVVERVLINKGYTHYKIAKESGINQTLIGNWFRFETVPSLKNFLALCELAEVNFFFEAKDSTTDLSKCFNEAMDALGRNPEKLPKN